MRRKVVAKHFYGIHGDPGHTGGACTVRVFWGKDAWANAVHFATDRMVRRVYDDPHPGRVYVQDVTPCPPAERITTDALWVSPEMGLQRGFTFEWRTPSIFGGVR